MLNKLTGGQNGLKDEREDAGSSMSLFKTDLSPLQRKQSVSARPKKQQAIVTPLQGKIRNHWKYKNNSNHRCKGYLLKKKNYLPKGPGFFLNVYLERSNILQ